ncbi:MAG: DUF6528 family protein [Tannerella sp.]|jgi:hypothetical protein|nr:DUF6528 family protein [Tannerella sp.]
MQKILRFDFSILAFIACCFTIACADETKEQLLITCGQDKILIIDAAASDGDNVKIVWQWDVTDPITNLPDEYRRALLAIDECKAVNNNSQLLFTGGSASVLMDRETRQCLFYARTPNSHSADLLPGNRIAVALSIAEKGNSLEVYDIGTPGRLLFRDSLYSGHGAVWNKQRNKLYVLGFDRLREYALQDWDSSTPSLRMTAQWALPEDDGHDLSLVSPDRFLITTHSSVYFFDIDRGTFTPFEPLSGIPNVKSVNYNESTEHLTYTKAEESWWTYHIYQSKPEKTIHIPYIRLYKVRVIQ